MDERLDRFDILQQRQNRSHVNPGRLEQLFADAAAQLVHPLVRRVARFVEQRLAGQSQAVRVDAAGSQANHHIAVDQPFADDDPVERYQPDCGPDDVEAGAGPHAADHLRHLGKLAAGDRDACLFSPS